MRSAEGGEGKLCRAVLAVAAALLNGCADPAPAALLEVRAPTVLRVGSPIEVRGYGLAGRALRLSGGPVDVALAPALASEADRLAGIQRAIGHLPDSPEWRAGQSVGAACLTGEGLDGWQACRAVAGTFTRQWGATALAWDDTTTVAWGDEVRVVGTDLLLPGEGTITAEVELAATATRAELHTTLATGRTTATLRMDPRWVGAVPGTRALRLRLLATVGNQTVAGPWSQQVDIAVKAPQLLAVTSELRRGWPLPLQVQHVGPVGAWRLDLTGPQPGWLPGAQDGAVIALSPWWWATIGQPPLAVVTGEARLVVDGPGGPWLGPVLPVKWPVARDVQVVEVVAGAGLQAGLDRLGLGTQRAAVQAAMQARLRAWFEPYRMEINVLDVASQWPGERLLLTIGDRDPAGNQALGADNQPHKDDGNRVLDEHLGGFDATAWQSGLTPFGGVFAGELLGFSQQLHPDAVLASAAFDDLLRPWAPALGGKPAGKHAGCDAAVAAIAAVLAEATAHEIGHALGLPAGTSQAHRPTDNPGWIMDAGLGRPFPERASLVGATPSTWGPVDAAYLQALLGK